MLSFGSAAFQADKTMISTFSANLELLPGTSGDPKTMAWWATQPEAWAAARRDCRDPAMVMPEYVAWLKALPGKGKSVADLYAWLFGLGFVKPRYLLRWEGKDVGQLSPGERGTLLLIFYLLIDDSTVR
jgi:hypothetical protein